MEKSSDTKRYRERIIDREIKRYLETFGAVCTEGTKGCGKTSSSSRYVNSEYLVADPSNHYQNKRLSEIDPYMVLQGETPRLIDEWQEAWEIWDAVRYALDQRGEKRQFILTES